MNDKQTLKLLSELWSDLRDPDFVWQVLALLISIGLAALVARAWRNRAASGGDTIHAAGSRLAFPLTAMALVGVAQLVLRNFTTSICSRWRCRCWAPWPSCAVSSMSFDAVFPRPVAGHLGKIARLRRLGLAGALYHRLGSHRHPGPLEQVSFRWQTIPRPVDDPARAGHRLPHRGRRPWFRGWSRASPDGPAPPRYSACASSPSGW